MATDNHVAQVERIIDYKFRSKNHHLQRARTAAGAEDENHDGNRKLAHIGDISMQYTLSLVAYRILPSRSRFTSFQRKRPTIRHMSTRSILEVPWMSSGHVGRYEGDDNVDLGGPHLKGPQGKNQSASR